MVEKMEGCEYPKVDKTSAPCHNPAVFIDREAGLVVCIAHADSLETFLKAEHEAFLALPVEEVPVITAQVGMKSEEKESAQGFKINTDKVPGSITPGL